jgi:hypothetical protein
MYFGHKVALFSELKGKTLFNTRLKMYSSTSNYLESVMA